MPQVGKGSGSGLPVRRLPLWAKVGYTAFMCALVPYYLGTYGPTNFFYFCDMALLLTLAALWLEKPLLAGIPAVGILMAQLLWIVDFLVALSGGHVTGMTDYMFDDNIPLIGRGFSLFHAWLPFLLLWILYLDGYDRRAFPLWTALAWVLMLVSYFLLPPPPAPKDNPNLPVNVNYVFGPSNDKAQTWMPPGLYMALVMIGYPLVLFLPAHLLLCKIFSPRGHEGLLLTTPEQHCTCIPLSERYNRNKGLRDC
jgi:hypothetical protein